MVYKYRKIQKTLYELQNTAYSSIIEEIIDITKFINFEKKNLISGKRYLRL